MADRNVTEHLRAIISRIESSRKPRTEGRTEGRIEGRIEISRDKWLPELVCTLGLSCEENEHGFVLARRQSYPASSGFGARRLEDSFAGAATYALLAQDPSHETFVPGDATFLDSETSGLAGGTGTHVFLVGLGTFEDDSFVLSQYLVPDPTMELPMLEAIAQAIRQKGWLVTYNGKAFDIPLLETRFTLNRRRSPFAGLGHFDLLHAARRLWRDALECSLGSLEHSLLGHERENDIPSALIPSVFFEYLRRRDPRLLLPVLEHNKDDVMAMAALLGHMCRRVESPSSGRPTAVEMYNLGRMFERAGRLDECAGCYQDAPHCDAGSTAGRKAMERLALVEKRQGNFARAAEIWSTVAREDPYTLGVLVELAKHFEHREKDCRQALEVCRAAIERIDLIISANPTPKNHTLLGELRRRKDRLEKKIQRTRPAPGDPGEA
jgi:hypothetical protein